MAFPHLLSYWPGYQLSSIARRVVVGGLLLALAMLPAPRAKADGVIDHLPADSLGFIHVHNLNTSNERIAKFIEMFQIESPTPLQFAELALGIGEGIDTEGDAMLASLAGEPGKPTPKPLFLLPISDYEKFAESIHADPSGEIGRVVIADAEVLVARKGDYAVMMNTEHRSNMESLLAADSQPLADVAPLGDWLAGNVASAVLLPAGVEQLMNQARMAMDTAEQQASVALADPALQSTAGQLTQVFKMYRALLEGVGGQLHVGALGISFDESNNLRVGMRAIEKGESLDLGPKEGDRREPLAGYAEQAFVIAGGGPAGGEWMNRMVDWSFGFMREMPQVYGLEDLDDDDWEQFLSEYRELLDEMQMQFTSFLVHPGERGQPIFGKIVSVVEVKDSAAYLAAMRRSMEMWNELMAKSTEQGKWQYEIEEKTIVDANGTEYHGVAMSMNIMAMMGDDPNVQMMLPMLQQLFGNGGILRFVYLAADESTVVYGMIDDAQLAELAGEVVRGEMGLQQSATIQTTSNMFSPEASWQIYISPPGFQAWVKRIVEQFIAPMAGQIPPIPDYPASPPIGISAGKVGSMGQVDVVCPKEMLEALAEYIETVKRM